MERRTETMIFALEGHLGAVERSVSSLEREGQPASAVTLSRGYETTIEDLWDAVTSVERISHWFTPVSGELGLGGRYQLEGNAGGVISECEPLSRFALTWEFAGDVSWGRGACLERRGRACTSDTHAHGDPVRALGCLWAWCRGRRLGVGPDGALPAYLATGRADARRGCLRHLAGRKGDYHRQQRGMGPSCGRGRRGRRGCRSRSQAHYGVLHRRIGRTFLIRGFVL